jgi:ABC-type Fe3+ transport system permease subunit
MTSLLNSTFVTQLTGGYNPYISPYLFETSIRYSSLAFLVGCIFALCLILIVNGGNDKYKFPSYKIFLYVIIASGVCFGLGMGFYYT